METQQKTAIDTIIENFDFETVLAYCTLADRKYRDEKITKQMLVETAQYCLVKVEFDSEKNSDCSTGMFHASKRTYSHGTHLLLEFVLKSWSEKLY